MSAQATNIQASGVTYAGQKLRLDTRLDDGALLLLNPAHPNGKWTTNLTDVPAFGSALPNIAYQEAIANIGSGTKASMSAALTNNGYVDTTEGKVTRSTLGGFYGIPSQTNDVSGHYYHIDMPALVANYFTTYPTHSYYFSLVMRVTRAGSASSPAALYARLSAATGGTILMSVSEGASGGVAVAQAAPTSGTNFIARGASVNTPSLVFIDVAVSGVPTGWSAGSALNTILNFFGPTGSSTLHKSPAWILYDLYLNDMTKGGGTYTTLHAAQTSWYTTNMLTAGGLYYGDTYTDPTTIP